MLKLRRVADSKRRISARPDSRLFPILAAELSDEFFAAVDNHLSSRFRRGVLVSARLGYGNWEPLCPRARRASRAGGPAATGRAGGFRCGSPTGMKPATGPSRLRGRGINLVANATAQSADHILSFFRMLRSELAFYVGCLNARDQLTGLGEPVCFPVPAASGQPELSVQGLYDACLSLRPDHRGGQRRGPAAKR